MELSPIQTKKKKKNHNRIINNNKIMSGGTTRDTESLTTEYTNELQSPTPSGLDDVYDDEFATEAAAAAESSSSSSSSNLRQQHQQRNNTNTNNTSQISVFDAIQHLIKGNLGPGCLNIPNAFALCGWILGSFLFLVVAIQGIYSMILLVYCKRWIRNDIIDKKKKKKLRCIQQEQEQLENDNDNNGNNEIPTATEDDDNDDDENEIENNIKDLNENNIRTFMDIAYISHGYYGSLIVQCLLFILQTGVCCVFLSLIATNLHAASIESNSNIQLNLEDCVFIISILLLGVVLIRDLKELKWLSLGANLLMILAIFTASITALYVLFYHNRDNNNNDNDNHDDNSNDDNEQNNEQYEYEKAKRYTTNPAEIATFISSMFYSFEGIGLVMPIENSFVGYTKTNTNTSNKNNNNSSNSSNNSNNNNNNNDECGDGGGVENGCNNSNEEEEQNEQKNEQQNIRIQKFINPVLVISMSIVGCLFLLIGITCGPAFPDMHNGSVTAYLTMKYPTIVWYKVINVFVMIAIFCTFPLQLTPAMEVLNEWFGPGCDPKCCSSSSSGSATNSTSSIITSTGTSNNTSASSNNTRLRGLLSVRRRRQRRRRRGHTQIAQQDNEDDDDDEFTTVEEEALAEDALAEEALAEEVEIHSSSNNNIISNNNNNSNSNSNNNNSRATSINTTVGDGAGDGDGSDGIFVMNSSSTTCFGQYEWIFRRYIVVFCCTIIVLSVNDLGLLMSLFGAVGNTGLAGMPCLIHLRLMKLNIAPYSGILRFIDIGTILLCTLVAITGVIFTLQEII